jgi:transposase-like protein
MKQIAPDGTVDLINRERNEILAARGIMVSHETIRQWSLKVGQAFANQIRRQLPRAQ